jgi:signal transduction histidine kinase
MILYHRLKPSSDRLEIEVIKDYGKLPAIDCYLGQLNQVFMNLLANAIDAIDESVQQKKSAELSINQIHQGLIKIQTQAISDDWISVSIKDNGLGMTNKVKSQIFKPFFTTKPVGKGTGIGLAMSHSIITEKHGGFLKCVSSIGHGTEFIVELPIRTQEGGVRS